MPQHTGKILFFLSDELFLSRSSPFEWHLILDMNTTCHEKCIALTVFTPHGGRCGDGGGDGGGTRRCAQSRFLRTQHFLLVHPLVHAVALLSRVGVFSCIFFHKEKLGNKSPPLIKPLAQ